MATDLDKLKSMAEDTIIHKKLVLDNCLLMSKHLMSIGKLELGTQLLKRGCEHDNSKFDHDEFRKLSKILKSRTCFTDANNQLSKEETKAIEYHWNHNRHHPEFFNRPSVEMTELDILEMVCDWFARSIQYKTDFLPFVEERQSNRFHFSDKKFSKIHDYCILIQELYNAEHKKPNRGYRKSKGSKGGKGGKGGKCGGQSKISKQQQELKRETTRAKQNRQIEESGEEN